MKSKKAQGISINTIIIAAIALIVLVVLVMIFTGRIGIFSKGVAGSDIECNKACQSLGYTGSETSGTGTPDTTVLNNKGESVNCYCKK